MAKMTNSQKKVLFESLEKMKGNIYKGYELESYIRKLFSPMDQLMKNWKLDGHVDDCSYVDEAGNQINEVYIHVEVSEETYTDVLCVINNIDDPKQDWVVLVKDIIRQ